MPTWNFWGLVIGRKLPAEWLTIPGLEIHPADEEEIQGLKEMRIDVPVDLNPPDPYHFDASRAPVHVESRWVLRFELEADDWDAAIEKARASTALYSSVLDASAPDAGKPIHLELLGVVNMESGESNSFPLDWHVYPVRVVDLSSEEAAAIERRLAYLLQDDLSESILAARAAAQLLRDATYLADTSMEVALLENASLLLYFQVVEGITQFVAKADSGLDASAVDQERAALISELSAGLADAASPEAASGLVHKKDYELRQAEATHLRQRIKASGATLGLDEPLIEEAIAFLRTRSSSLAHFGAALPDQAKVHWFVQRHGRRVAVSFFAAFLDWLSSRENDGHVPSGAAAPVT